MGNIRNKTVTSTGTARNAAALTVESDDAGSDVDILDADLETALGYTPTAEEFYQDFRAVRVPIEDTDTDEAAATISLTSVARNGGDDGWTVTFSTAAAATKRVGVRLIRA